ncbi:MAG: glycosyltransferase [Patescibacteria group bacterium]|nr:glycosyltransferase [Patescibacteria group bacterium]
MKNLIKKFNNEKNFIVITTYPPKNSVYNGKGGLSSFGKNFLNHLNNISNNQIIVFSQKEKKSKIYLENNKKILIIPIIKRDSILSFFNILKIYLSKLNKIKKLIIQFEFNSFGGIKSLIGFIFLNFILTFCKKKIYLILHQIEPNLNNLYGHLGWKKNGIKSKIFNFLIKTYYFLICLSSKKIFVLEEIFKKKLISLKIPRKKIIVIPHGVDNKFIIKKIKNNNNLIHFGYLSWYKGVDWLIENINKKEKLIIAGGPSPNLLQKKHYKNFLKEIKTKIKNKKNIIITGFVKEQKIQDYFNKSKIILFPYRTMISSSGPFSLAFSFEKPFILSRPLEGYFESPDFAEALKETGLKKEDFLFDFTPESFEKRLEWAKNNLDKLSKFSRLMKKKRSWDKVAEKYLETIKFS